MQKDDLVYVGHMLDMAIAAAGKIAGIDRAQYDADENLRLALAHLIQTIGEAARRVSSEYQQQHTQIPWSRIIGMRHKVVHDYLHVDFDLVWDVVTAHIPPLVAELRSILPADQQ
jgi:uncharacterized protein with HEPN domain